ncbi:hypothetical protein EUTSA_v10005499mg [Eutrema salsugineum]|uniref:Uncharacterized protein n=1 Tax=Eutrema salsugineum TaxID=72664 RepID=V4KQA8_EUTSA|nr:hypothetical protein EUTSA_v10005499mg [Eutrema salsugineum]
MEKPSFIYIYIFFYKKKRYLHTDSEKFDRKGIKNWKTSESICNEIVSYNKRIIHIFVRNLFCFFFSLKDLKP